MRERIVARRSLLFAKMSSSSTTPHHTRQPRRFAPLNPEKANIHNAPKLRGIVFDVDGTLCLPQNYMFGLMRAALSIPKSVDILTHIQSLAPDPAAQEVAREKIRQIERDAMVSQQPQPGLRELMAYLERRGIMKGLCTRNFMGPVQHLLGKFLSDEDGAVGKFKPIVTRETEGIRPKPSPEGIWSIAGAWGMEGRLQGDINNGDDLEMDHPLEIARRALGSGLIMVGDSIDDMESGYRAGAATVLLANEENEELAKHKYTDLSVRRLDELIEILERGFEGRS